MSKQRGKEEGREGRRADRKLFYQFGTKEMLGFFGKDVYFVKYFCKDSVPVKVEHLRSTQLYPPSSNTFCTPYISFALLTLLCSYFIVPIHTVNICTHHSTLLFYAVSPYIMSTRCSTLPTSATSFFYLSIYATLQTSRSA